MEIIIDAIDQNYLMISDYSYHLLVIDVMVMIDSLINVNDTSFCVWLNFINWSTFCEDQSARMSFGEMYVICDEIPRCAEQLKS